MEESKARTRHFFRFRVENSSFKIFFLDVGAFSFKQAHLLTILGLRTINERAQRINHWTIPRPEGAPQKGAFIMHKGELLKPCLKEGKKIKLEEKLK